MRSDQIIYMEIYNTLKLINVFAILSISDIST